MKYRKMIVKSTFVDAEEDATLHRMVECDEAGNEILEITYSDEAEEEDRYEHVYTDGFKTEAKHWLNGELTEHHKYSKGTDGKVATEETSFLDGTIGLKKFEYADKVITVTLFDEFNNLEEKEVRTYNDQNLLIEKIITNEENLILEKHINIYNEAGKLSKQTEYGTEGEFISEKEFHYGDNGMISKILTYTQSKKLIDAVYYYYDEKARVIEQKFTNRYIIQFTYDDELNTELEERFMANGALDYQMLTFYDENKRILKQQQNETLLIYTYEN